MWTNIVATYTDQLSETDWWNTAGEGFIAYQMPRMPIQLLPEIFYVWFMRSVWGDYLVYAIVC